jgi:hypothetical protein
LYTVRLTKAGKAYETQLPIVLDRRATFTAEDRAAQFHAAMRAHALFGRMTDLADRLAGLKALAEERQAAPKLPKYTAELAKKFADSADRLRKEIVATKEGGAITGEERLREHLDDVYGALLSYEGRPGDYQIARIEALERELQDVEDRAAALVRDELPKLNKALGAAGLETIAGSAADRAGVQLAAIEALRNLRNPDQRGAATRQEE